MRNPLVRRLQTYFCRSNKYVTIAQDCTFNIVSISPARATIGPKIEKECQKNEKKKEKKIFNLEQHIQLLLQVD